MIGMSQIKKKFYMGMGIGIGIGVLGIIISGIITFTTVKSYEEGTNKNYNKKFTKMVVVAKSDIMQGTTVTEDMIQKVRVHKNAIPSTVLTDLASGMVAKYNITANTAISEEMLTDDIKSSDVRLQEINAIVMPTDLTEEEYIDIRITYPNGTDYIVLAGKKVEKITGETILIELNEDERQRLNGAIVDSFLTKGTKLYATKYVDSSSQISLEAVPEEKVKETLLNLIREELPEIELAPETESKENTENAESTENNEISSKNEEYVNKMYNFIVKYRNMVATTKVVEENYQPNEKIINEMRTNPNIMQEAKNKLNSENRSLIENLNNQYAAENEEEYDGLVSGVTQSIEKQKEERNSLLSE